MRENPAGEAKNGDIRLQFDRRLRLEFRGAKITTDAGLLAVRELDEMMGLTDMAADLIEDKRTGKNIQHQIPGLLRQSVYARLAGYEDVNDQEALARDPAMRAVIGNRALDRNAASSGTVSRFETEILAQDENIDALSSLNSAWVSKAVSLSKAKKVVLDIDSSESPVHGNQEGSAYNGHFESTCYHPLFWNDKKRTPRLNSKGNKQLEKGEASDEQSVRWNGHGVKGDRGGGTRRERRVA